MTRSDRESTLPGMGATTSSAGSADTSRSAWAPLRSGSFRALWLAALVGLTGIWFQTVGAQWLLVSHPHASILVSLVQVATTLPYVLFGLVAGVLADTLDRRLILISVQLTVAGLGVVLAALTLAHLMPPALLSINVARARFGDRRRARRHRRRRNHDHGRRSDRALATRSWSRSGARPSTERPSAERFGPAIRAGRDTSATPRS